MINYKETLLARFYDSKMYLSGSPGIRIGEWRRKQFIINSIFTVLID